MKNIKNYYYNNILLLKNTSLMIFLIKFQLAADSRNDHLSS